MLLKKNAACAAKNQHAPGEAGPVGAGAKWGIINLDTFWQTMLYLSWIYIHFSKFDKIKNTIFVTQLFIGCIVNYMLIHFEIQWYTTLDIHNSIFINIK